MKRIIRFLRENCARIAATAALLFLACWWGICDLGFVPGAVAIILWTR